MTDYAYYFHSFSSKQLKDDSFYIHKKGRLQSPYNDDTVSFICAIWPGLIQELGEIRRDYTGIRWDIYMNWEET